MDSGFRFHGLGLTDLIILVGICGYLVDRIVDARGWSRSSRTLRRENEDLVRRNTELEQIVVRHQAEIDRLSLKVADLEKTNLKAAIDRIADHEQQAAIRHDDNLLRAAEQYAVAQQTLDTLVEIREQLKGA